MECNIRQPTRNLPPAILLLGPTGAGKTPLGEALERQGDRQGIRYHHFDFGQQLRQAAATPPGRPPWHLDDNEHAVVRACLERGALLENETFGIALKILQAFTDQHERCPGDRLLLNGLPRHVDQARMLSPWVDIRSVLLLDIDPETVWERIRRNTGGDRRQRTDDTPDAVRQRLAIYHQRTRPLVDYYADAGVNIIRLAVSETTTADDLVDALATAPAVR